MTGSLLDDVLDRTVVVGYTSVGYLIRSHGWSASELRPMNGKVVLITGASSALGLAAGEGFARLGATVWLVVRTRERGEHARARIAERSGSDDVHVGVCDLSNLETIRQFAGGFTDQASRLDVLVGVMTRERAFSAHGIELTLATDVVSPFALTNLLIALLQRSTPARIINVPSGGMYTQKLRVEDLQSEHGQFDGPTVIARTKRAQVILTEIWAQQQAGTGVVVHAMHPGWADTPGVRPSLPRFYKATRPLLRTPAQGAETITWLGAAAEPGRSSGRFWHDRQQRPTHLLPWTTETRQERKRLLTECVRLSAPQITGPGPASSNPKENRDGPLSSNDRHPATPRGRVRIPQRLLDNRAMGSGRR